MSVILQNAQHFKYTKYANGGYYFFPFVSTEPRNKAMFIRNYLKYN